MTLPSLPMATLRERVIEQKFRVLAGQLRFAMSGNVIAAFALAVLIWDKADQTVISTWLLIIIAASGLRFFIHHKISQASRRGQSLSSWGPYLTAVMTANGFAWGGLSFTLMQPQANFLIASTLSVTIGVIAGALGSLAIYRPAFWGFTMAALAPIIVRFFSFGVIEFTIAGILLIIFGGILVRFGMSQEQILVDQIQANITKDDLIKTINQSRLDEKRSEKQVKAMLDSSAAGIAIIDRNGLIIYTNDNFTTMFGYADKNQTIGLLPEDCFADPADFALVNAAIADFGEVSRLKVRQRSIDGREWWCLLDLRPIIFNGAQAFISWRYDITNQVQIEEEALANSAFLSLTLETVDQGILVIDEAERIVLFNQHACDLAGVTADFLDARPTLSALFDRQHAHGEFDAVSADVLARLSSRSRFKGDQAAATIERQRADGSWVLESCHRNDQGWLVLTFQDITDLKLVEADAVEKARLLELTLDNMGQGLTMYDQDWKLLVRNDRYRQHFDLPQEVFKSAKSFDDIVGPTMRQDYGESEWRERLQAVRSPRRMKETWRRSFTRPNGRGIDLLSLPVPGGGFVVTSTDITERLRIEAEAVAARDAAEAAAQSKANFLATMSHEIRTPMNGVMTTAEILAQSPLDDEQQQLVLRLQQSAHILLTVINDVLDFSKIEAGKMTLEAVAFDPLEIIEQTMTLFQPSAEEKDLRLILRPETPLPLQLTGDVSRFRQLLINLLGNAVKFTAEGQVTVAVRATSDESGNLTLCVTIRDTGIGIAAAQMETLFDPFRQGDASISRAFGGTGLGLAICKRVCELMGGRIGVRSPNPTDQGATFWFELPFKQNNLTLDTPSDWLKGRQVWLLGYQAAEVESLRLMIAPLGGDITWFAEDEIDAAMRDLAKPGGVDVIICDAQMGISAVAAIDRKFAKSRQNIPTILTVSARHLSRWRNTDMAANQALDVRNMISLPIEMRRLRQYLHAIINESGAERQENIAGKVTKNRAWGSYTAPMIDVARQAGVLILVVEDNEINQFVIGRLLDRLGFAYELAENGEKAIEKLSAGSYGLALIDIHMPVMNGFELAKLARRQGLRNLHGDRMPIVALTADAMVSVEVSCLQAGMDGYLRKPIEVEKLLELIAQFIPEALQLRENLDPDAGSGAGPKLPSSRRRVRPAVVAATAEASLPVGHADTAVVSNAAIEMDDLDIFADIDESILNPAQLAMIFESFDGQALDFLEKVMQNLNENITALYAASQAEDSQEVRRIAHDLKAISAMAGASQLQEMATAIQSCVDSSDGTTVATVLETLPAAHDNVTQAYTLLTQRLNANS